MKDQFSLNDIKTNTDDVELDIWNNPLYVSYDLGSDGVITVVCKDADGQEIQTTEVDQENHILPSMMNGLQIYRFSRSCLPIIQQE